MKNCSYVVMNGKLFAVTETFECSVVNCTVEQFLSNLEEEAKANEA